MSESTQDPKILSLATKIVLAHISHNDVAISAIPGFIRDVYQTLATVDAVPTAPVSVPEQKPAVPINKSVFSDYIICLEDGKRLQMMKRHLATAYSMTPAQYRVKWGLPPDYPIVAPNYAKRRSALAKESGLGRRDVDFRKHKAPSRRKRA